MSSILSDNNVSTPFPDFGSAKLKIQWANIHIDHLSSTIDTFLSSDFYTFSNEFDHESGHYVVSVSSKPYPPAEIYLLLGDIIHNLRSALDHIATAIVGNGNNVYSPFHQKLENLISSDGTIVCRKTRDIEATICNLGRFIIAEIKPYEAGNPFLWKLSKLDAIDKHKFLIPAISLTSVTAFDLHDRKNNNRVGQATGTVGPGGKVNLIGSSSKYEVEGKIEATFEVLFTKETYFDEKPVIETLNKISKAVSETLSHIEGFIRRIGEA